MPSQLPSAGMQSKDLVEGLPTDSALPVLVQDEELCHREVRLPILDFGQIDYHDEACQFVIDHNEISPTACFSPIVVKYV